MINMIIIIMTHKVINANLFIALEFFYYTFRFLLSFFTSRGMLSLPHVITLRLLGIGKRNSFQEGENKILRSN